MPCRSDYMEPTGRERESFRVQSLLYEIGLREVEPSSVYGDPFTLDLDTDLLCQWCKANPDKIATKSLELQIWWRDHQVADAKREEQEKEQQRINKIRKSALSKLTKEEKEILGI